MEIFHSVYRKGGEKSTTYSITHENKLDSFMLKFVSCFFNLQIGRSLSFLIHLK